MGKKAGIGRVPHIKGRETAAERPASDARGEAAANEGLRSAAQHRHLHKLPVDPASSGSEAVLRALLEAAGDAIITVNRLGVIESFSRVAERMFGYEAREAVGQEISLLVALPDQQEHRRLIKDFLQERRLNSPLIRRQTLGRHRNGEAIPLEVTFGELQPGRLFIAILRDTSEQRKLERLVLHIAEHEKLHVAADLHATICQELTGIGFLASALERELRAAGRPEADRVQVIAQKILESAERTHTLARGMAPAIDRPRGLMIALQGLADGIACLHGVHCRYVCSAPVQVEDADTASHLYYIAQEALRNAIRHSRAGRVEIRLREADDRISLIVQDNGVGIAEDPLQGPGIGVKLMRYRSELLQGRLLVERRRGGGTRVVCEVPTQKTAATEGRHAP
jgi:two-component system sensor kinase FixL